MGTLLAWEGPVCRALPRALQTHSPGWCTGPVTHPGVGHARCHTSPVPGGLRLLTGSLRALAQATLGIAEACVHGGAAPGPRLGAADKAEAEPVQGRAVAVDKAAPQPPLYQQKGWKSANLAQPFSSRAEVLGVLAAHTLEPTSTATPGAGAGGVTGSSNTVHVGPAGVTLWLRSRQLPDPTRGEDMPSWVGPVDSGTCGGAC